MKRVFIVIAVLVVASGLAWWGLGHKPARKKLPVVASVRVAPLKIASVRRRLIAYGRIVAAPSAIHALTEPFEVAVGRLYVNLGQPVKRGAPLMALVPSANTHLALLRAQTAYRLAQLTLQETKSRYRLRLATRSQLLVAQRGYDDARLSLHILKREGLRAHWKVTAPVSGVVSRILVPEGATVAAGQPLMDLVARDRVEARLGVEPGDMKDVQSGASVTLVPFSNSNRTVTGKVSVVSQVVNPATHMVDVFAALPTNNTYLLGEYVEGRFEMKSPPVLVAPRAAVLPSDHHAVVFTISNGRAVAHTVRMGVRNHRVVQIIDPHLHAGEAVVVLGNYELKPGMRVAVR